MRNMVGLASSLGEVQGRKLCRFQDPKGPGAQISGLSVPRILQIMVLEPKSPKPSTRVSNTHDRWIFCRIHGSSLRAHNEQEDFRYPTLRRNPIVVNC